MIIKSQEKNKFYIYIWYTYILFKHLRSKRAYQICHTYNLKKRLNLFSFFYTLFNHSLNIHNIKWKMLLKCKIRKDLSSLYERWVIVFVNGILTLFEAT